mgnify:FL=1
MSSDMVGLLSIISSIAIVAINNWHTRRLKKMELDSSESLKKVELNAQIYKDVALSERDKKYKVFSDFMNVATRYIFNYSDEKTYSELLTAYSKCLAIGLSDKSLNKFMFYVHHPNENYKIDSNDMYHIQQIFQEISQEFNRLLNEPLKPLITD